MTALIKLRIVGVRSSDHLGHTNNGRRVGITMIKEDVIANSHLSHEISGLVVPNTIPTGDVLG
jgi:hypothetical protein